LEDVLDTALLFIGPWSTEDSLAFLKKAMNLTYEERPYGYIDIPEDQIPDMTYLPTQRFGISFGHEFVLLLTELLKQMEVK
jgi:hypothetical protein